MLLSGLTLTSGWLPQGPAPILGGGVQNVTNTANGSLNNAVAGAVQVIVPDPSNAEVVYIGAVNGGVWRTKHAATNDPIWEPLTDSEASLSIGSLSLDPVQDPNSLRPKLLAGIGNVSSYGGRGGPLSGLLYSTDADTEVKLNSNSPTTGPTWTAINPLGIFTGQNIVGVAARGNTFLAATNNVFPTSPVGGLYISMNQGVTFALVPGLPAGNVSDLVGDPSNSNVFYAAVLPRAGNPGGIFRSTDAFATPGNITDITGIVLPSFNNDFDGNPYDNTVNVKLAVNNMIGGNNVNDPVNGNVTTGGILGRVFVGVVNNIASTGYTFSGVWEADDIVTLTVGGIPVSITAGSTDISQIIDALVIAWNASPIPTGVTASRSGNEIRWTPNTAGPSLVGTVSTTEADGSAPDAQTIDGTANSTGVVVPQLSRGKLRSLFTSANSGTNWTPMTMPPNLHPGSSGDSFFSIAVNRAEPSAVYVAGDRQPRAFDENPNEILVNQDPNFMLNFGVIQPGQAATLSIPVVPATPNTRFTIVNARMRRDVAGTRLFSANVIATPLGNLGAGLSYEADIAPAPDGNTAQDLNPAVNVTVTNYGLNPIDPPALQWTAVVQSNLLNSIGTNQNTGRILRGDADYILPQDQWLPITDAGSYLRVAEKITGMTRIPAAGPITISATNVIANNVVQNGEQVYVYGATGATGLRVNGLWTVSGATTDGSSFTLNGSNAIPMGAITDAQFLTAYFIRLVNANQTGPFVGSGPHADSRDLAFSKDGILLEADDGGLFRRLNSIPSVPVQGRWRSQNSPYADSNFQISEVHSVDWDANRNIVLAGTQDNGTIRQVSRSDQMWQVIGRGDGGKVAIDDSSTTQSIYYHSSQFLGGFLRTTFAVNDGGSSDPNVPYNPANDPRSVPISMSILRPDGTPNGLTYQTFNAINDSPTQSDFYPLLELNAINKNRLVIGSRKFLYESLDQGGTLRVVNGFHFNATTQQFDPDILIGNVRALAYGGRAGGIDQPNVLFAGTQQGSNSSLYVVLPGSTTNLPVATFINSIIRDIVLDPADWTTVYVLMSNSVYVVKLLPDGTLISSTPLPPPSASGYLNTIAYVPSPRFGTIVVGDSNGIYATSTETLGTWVNFAGRRPNALPNVRVEDLRYDAVDDVLVAGTLGRGVWTLANASRALSLDVAKAGDLTGLDLEALLAGNTYLLTGASVVNGNVVTPLNLVVDGNGDRLLQDVNAKTVARLIYSDRAEGSTQQFTSTGRFYVAPSEVSDLVNDASTTRGFQGLLRLTFSFKDSGQNTRQYVADVAAGRGYSTAQETDAVPQTTMTTLHMLRLQQRLRFLGFRDSTGQVPALNGLLLDPSTAAALKLFQAVVDPTSTLIPTTATGLLDSATAGWLNSLLAPRWILTAFNTLAEPFGTSWLNRILVAAMTDVNIVGLATVGALSTPDGVNSVNNHLADAGRKHRVGMEVDFALGPSLQVPSAGPGLSADEQKMVDLVLALDKQAKTLGVSLNNVVSSNLLIVQKLQLELPSAGAVLGGASTSMHVGFGAPSNSSGLPDGEKSKLRNFINALSNVGQALQNIIAQQFTDAAGVPIPFTDAKLKDVLVIAKSFEEVAKRLLKSARITGTGVPALVVPDPPLLISLDGGAPVRAFLPAGTYASIDDLVASLNSALGEAGLSEIVTAGFDADGFLTLETTDAALGKTLTLTTLELAAPNAGPDFGQLAQNVSFSLGITTLDSQTQLPITATVAMTLPQILTADNVSLADLAADLNVMFTTTYAALPSNGKVPELLHLFALVDLGNDPDPEDDRLLLVSNDPGITKLLITDVSQLSTLGFTSGQMVQDSDNPIASDLKLVGTRAFPEPKYNTLEELMEALKEELSAVSDTPLPDSFDTAWDYNSVTDEVTFNIALNKSFAVAAPLDFTQGIDLGNLLGKLEITASADASLSADVALQLRLGIFLGDQGQNFQLTTATVLSDISAGDGVPINVGITAPGELLANGRFSSGQSESFSLQVNGGAATTITVSTAATSDNFDPFALAHDINMALVTAALITQVAASIKTTFDSVHQPHYQLVLSALVRSVRKLDVSGGIAFGFTGSQTGDRPDLNITVGNSSYLIDLDGLSTVGAVINKITSSVPGVSVVITAANHLTLTGPSGQALSVVAVDSEGVVSGAATALGILGSSRSGDPINVIVGDPLHGENITDRLFIVPPQAGESNLTLHAKFEASNIDLRAALGLLEIGITDVTPLTVEATLGALTLTDPGTVANTAGRITYRELTQAPLASLVTVLGAPLLVNVSGQLALTDSILSQLTDGDLATLSVSLATPNVLSSIHFDVDTTGLQNAFKQLKQLSLAQILTLVDSLVSTLKDSQSIPVLNNKIPLINRSLNDILGLADKLLDLFNEGLAPLNVLAVQTAYATARTAVANLDVAPELKEKMDRALDGLQAVLAGDVDRLPSRLVSAAGELRKAITAFLGGQLTADNPLEQDLVDAFQQLEKLVPSLNSLTDRIEEAVNAKLPNYATFHLAWVDYDGIAGDDHALVAGLEITPDINVSITPDLTTQQFSSLQLNGQADFKLYAGAAFNLGIGLHFSSTGNSTTAEPIVIIKPPVTPNPDIVPTSFHITAGMGSVTTGLDGSFDGDVKFGNLDLAHGILAGSLTAAKTDTLPVVSGSVTLSNVPAADKHFLFVYNQAGLLLPPEDYELAGSTIQFGGQTIPTQVTVVYRTLATPDLSDPINRASFQIGFNPSISTGNVIGAVAGPISTLFNTLTQNLVITSNGLLTSSLAVGLLNGTPVPVLTAEVNVSDLLHPRLDVDDEALDKILANIDFDICTIAEGTEAFLQLLEDGLKSQVLQKVPIIGGQFDLAGSFLGKLRTQFVVPFRVFVCDLTGTFSQVETDVETFIYNKLGPSGLNILGDRNGNNVVDPADVEAKLDTQHFEVNFKLEGDDTLVATSFGNLVDGLPIEVETQGGLHISLHYEGDVGIGVSRSGGLYLITKESITSSSTDPAEFTFSLDAGLDVDRNSNPPVPTALKLKVLGLGFMATDILDPAQNYQGGTGVHLSLTLDLKPTEDNHLVVTDIGSRPFSDLFVVTLAGSAEVALHLDASLNPDLPSVGADLKGGISFQLTNSMGSGFTFHVDPPTIGFYDIALDAGAFLTKYIRPIVTKVKKYLDPIRPLIDLLGTEVPGVSDISKAKGQGPVYLLDLAFLKDSNPEHAEKARKFLGVAQTIFKIADALGTDDGHLRVEFGDLVFGGSSGVDLSQSGWNDPQNSNASAVTNVLNNAQAQAMPADDQVNQSGKPAAGFYHTVKRDPDAKGLGGLGIQLDFLKPINIFKYLIHQPADIITWKIPELTFGFEWGTAIHVYAPPPIDLTIGLHTEATVDLSVGFDTHGLLTGRFFDGFFFGDRESISTGEDIPELTFALGVSLGLVLNLGLVKAGVEGELLGEIEANWRDLDNDGKMHLDEIRSILKSDGLKCLFDLTGTLSGIIRLVYEIPIVGKGSLELFNQVLFTFMNHCPVNEPAHVSSGGEALPASELFQSGATSTNGMLIVHAGAFAGLRNGSASDVSESYTITQMAPHVFQVEGMGLDNRYSGVDSIFVDGGNGDDLIKLVGVTVPTTLFGGAGNDTIFGSNGDNQIDGGAGDDSIQSGDGGDHILGGSGRDLIFSGDGNDTIQAGAGDDIVESGEGDDQVDGDAGVDSLTGGNGADTISGGPGNDMVLGEDGADELHGGSGADSVVGAEGNDSLFGDSGNDQLDGGNGSDFLYGGNDSDLLLGGAGSDTLLGGWGNDAILGYLLQNHADTSPDYIEGGPDNDFICGANGGDTILGGTGNLGLTLILADQTTAVTPSASGFHLDNCDSIPVYTAPMRGTISGQVFRDNDADALQQATEPGLNVWTVKLLDDQNAVVAIQITADMDLNNDGAIDPQTESGLYSFASVDPGVYHIQAVLQAGFIQTTTDSMLTVSDGQNVLNDDVGVRFLAAEIAGRKFDDSNGNGMADAGERGVNGWEVQLLDADGQVVATQLTVSIDLNDDHMIDPVSETGFYVFTDLVPGTYTVSEVPRPDWVQSFPKLAVGSPNVFLPIADDDGSTASRSQVRVSGLNAATSNVRLTLNLAHADVEQLRIFLQSPSGTQVSLFANGGGQGDNLTSTEFNDAASAMIHTVTAADAPFTGSFQPEEPLARFNGEDPNGLWTLIVLDDTAGVSGRLLNWSLKFSTGLGTQTFDKVTPDPKTSAHGNSYEVILNAGDKTSAKDFGNYRPVEIHGQKFEDLNGNGIRDRNEPGLNGWTIHALNGGHVVASQVTADRDLNGNGKIDPLTERGLYWFTDLLPATYTVAEVQQTGWAQSFPGTVAPSSPSPLRQSLASSSQMPTLTISPVSLLEGNSGTTLAVFTVNLSAPSMDSLRVNYFTTNGTATAASDYGAANGSLVFAPGTTTKTISIVVSGDNQRESDETFFVSVGFPDAAGGTTIVDEAVGTILNDDTGREIHGQKFEDLNANGVRDMGELGLNGWTIQLVNALGQVTHSTTTTDIDLNQDGSINPQTESGLYQFNNLSAGTYLVREVLQSGWTQSTPDNGSYTVLVPGDSLLYTVTNTNELAAIDVVTHSVVIIGVTRDSAVPPVNVRRIRGLAYDSTADILYGMTREGNLVTVNRTTGQTTLVYSLVNGDPTTEFWSGLAFDGSNQFYTTNAFGGRELVQVTRTGNSFSETFVGSTTFGAGATLQILGLDFYPASAPATPVTFNGTHPTTNVLYGSNRNNNNIVVVKAANGSVTMPFGNQTVGVNNLQEIAFHPMTGELYAIHDHSSQSNQENAALSVFNFTTATSTEWGGLPFGIVESFGAGGGTYGWGGLAFAPAPAISDIRSYDFGNYRRIFLPDGDDVIEAGGGDDLVHGDNLVSNPLVVSVGSRRDMLFGDGGFDMLFGQEADDVLSGGPDADLIDGGDGTDRVMQEVNANQTLTNTLLTGEGPDTLVDIERATLIGGASANVIDATQFTLGSVTLIGKGGNDTLQGSAADDFLQGDEGDDSLVGGIGNDTYVFVGPGLGTDTIVESPNLDSDTLDFSGFTQAVVVDLQTAIPQTVNAGHLVFALGDATALENVIGSSLGDMIQGNGRNNMLVGGPGNDTAFGGLGNDTLRGSDDDDELHGDAGNDVLTGGLDDDLLDGGAGSDLLSEAGSGDFTLTNSSLTGVGADMLSGLEAANLTGDAGLNRFTVSGWTGSGTLDGAGGGNTVISTNNANSNATFTLTDTSLSVTGSAGFSLVNIGQAILTGGSASDTIDASAFTGITTLDGGAGVDILRGGSGNDFLDGGTGNDQLSGNSGNDTYRFANNWGTDTIVELAGQGFDTLDFGAITTGLVFQRGTATLSVSDLSGNSATHSGNSIEWLIGGSGDDAFVFDDGANLSGGAGMIDGKDGINTLDDRAFTTSVAVNLMLSQATGLSALQHIQIVRGGSAADLLVGDDFDNTLFGNDGNDTLKGGKGADALVGGKGFNTLIGGAGDDKYIVEERPTGGSSETDHFQEDEGVASHGLAAGGGNDTIDLSLWTHSVTFDLGNLIALTTPSQTIRLEDSTGGIGAGNFENVIGSLTQTNDLTGNAADNQLTGGSQKDLLTGGAGNDVLRGGAENDTLRGGDDDDVYVFESVVSLNEVDQVSEEAGRGIDTLDFRISAALTVDLSTGGTTIGSHINRMIQVALAGQAANFENVIGGSGDDHLTGNVANNHLQGGGGNDELNGGPGQDLLEGGTGSNILHGGVGHDTLVGSASDTFDGGVGNNVILQGAGVVVAPLQLPNAAQLELAYRLAGNTVVQGTFHDRRQSVFTLSFYAATNLSSALQTVQVTTDGNGDQHFTTMFTPALAAGSSLTATATDMQGNISQFSANRLVQASVDFAVGLTVDNSAPLTGSTIHYTVSVQNTSSNLATGVIVKDQLPAEVTFVSASPSVGTYDDSSGIWSVGNLAAGASSSLVITATVDLSAAGQNIVNTAIVTVSDQVDATANNNTAHANILSPLATLRGRKFADTNGNGIRDAGDVGLAGWIIEVRDLQGTLVDLTATMADDTQTGTDETGLYSFSLAAGSYRVTEVLQPGWQQTLPGSPSFTHTVTLVGGQILNDQNFANRLTGIVVGTSGQQSNGQDFGNYSLGSVHGFKFEDWDGDGHYDVGVEPRLRNVQFTLTGTTGMGQALSPAVQVVTDINGEFAFTGLAPGSYTVTETVPTGYTATTPTSFTRTLRSGEELVAYAGQAKLPADDPRHEVVVGQSLMFGNLPDGVDLEVVKTVSANPVFAGSGIKNLTYLVTVTNRGLVNATGVKLSEDLTLPSGVTLVSVTPSRGTLWSLTKTPDGTWNVGNLSRGASATLTIVLTVSGSAASGTNVIRNTATVTASNQSRYHTADDTATVSTSIRRLDLVVRLPDFRNTVVVSRTGSGDAALLRVRQGTTDLITPTRINTVGSLRIEGGNAADDVTFDSTLVGFLVGTLEVNGNGGNDRMNAAALRVTSVQIGPAFAAIREHGVSLNGGDGDDSLIGGDGPDVLNGGAGSDVLTGNAGNDSLSGGSGTDRLIESADANLTLTNTSLVGVGLDVLSGFESAQLTGGKGKNALNASGFTLGPVLLFGSDGDDSLTGTNAADVLDGGLGNDLLIGLGENDSLTGGAGNDVLNGGEGSDVVVETANVNLTLTNSALAGVGTDTLIGIERAFLTGGAAGNKFDASRFTLGAVSLDGLGGNDTLLGGTGDDTLTGKLGNDSLVGGAGTDRLVESGDVNFLLTKVQLTGLGTDVLATIEEVSLTGGAGNNTLTVKDFVGMVTLRGAAGNDSLFGGGGNDVLEGDLGDDQLSGGAGDDQLDGGAGTDVVVESGSAAYTLSDSLLIGAGADALLSIELARLTLSNTGGSINASNFAGRMTLTGGTANDSIIGGTGADLLIGGDGADTLAGNAGDDTLTGGLANDSLNGGAGNDLLSETGDVASLILTNGALAGLGSDVLAAIERALLIGGAAINSFDASAFTLGPVTLIGGGANDSLLGGSGADSLDGGLGNDTLKGGAGNDTLTGGADSDAFDGGLDTDLLSEIANVNLVLNATQFTGLGTDTHTGIETAFLIGGAGGNKFDATLFGGSVTLIGNVGNDTLMGTAKADSLDGGDGNDKLQGGAGNDTLSGGRGSDMLEGGADNDVLDGEADADSLIGGTGRDLLIGGAALDTLAGGPDEDILIGGTTSYTGNGTALNAIMAEWTSANAYPTRIANLLNGGGANGSTVLNATTVQNDTNAADKINGSLAAPNNTDLDWFFQSAGDVLDAINGEVRTTI